MSHGVRFLMLALALVCLAVPATAQRVKRVQGVCVYHAPENVTLEQAKLTALHRAQIQALADEFGTVVSQSNATRIENSGDHSDVDLISLGGSEVRGEWIETIGDPVYDITYDQGMLVVKCTVTGKARELLADRPVFTATLLRNGTEAKYASEVFRSGDDLYLQFRSPVDGYLNVYLDDGQGNVAAMLPYRSQGFGATPIEANRDYLFFSARDGGPEVDEYTMTCNGDMELNQVVLVFSQNPFTRVSAVNGVTDTRTFLAWLAKLKSHDKQACSQTIAIQVKP